VATVNKDTAKTGSCSPLCFLVNNKTEDIISEKRKAKHKMTTPKISEVKASQNTVLQHCVKHLLPFEDSN
jgi:hypothetical protein